jgi:hypothetical protein
MRSSDLEKLTTRAPEKRKCSTDKDDENDPARPIEEQNKRRKCSHTNEAGPVQGKSKGKTVAKRGRKK